jgi:large subunit ribosomal protein L15
MQLHTIKKGENTTTAKTRIGRGGKRGKTSGHGHKGQKQHGRHGIRPEMRDFIKSLPKLRGFGKNRGRTVNADKAIIRTVKLSALEVFKAGETVSPSTLVAAGILKKEGNKLPKVKILTDGDIKTKVIIEGCLVSGTAKEAIEKAGGEVK